jgi:hypothetical protein
MKSVLTLAALSCVAWPAGCSKTSVHFPPFNNPYPAAYQSTATGLYPNGAAIPIQFKLAGQASNQASIEIR